MQIGSEERKKERLNMQKKRSKPIVRHVCALLLLMSTLMLSSCGTVWSWLWSREESSINIDELVIGEMDPSEETKLIFEEVIEYTGEAHSGTDICYLGKDGSPNQSRIIVIDAGHQLKGSSALEPNGPGSEIMKAEVTWGAKGVYTSQPEYDLNLQVALLLRHQLIQRGYSVVMIRETNNVSISNMERALLANKHNASAYIRIHGNSWSDGSMHGAMTICQSANNPYADCAAHYVESRKLSELVLDEFCSKTGIFKQNVREMDDMTGTNWSQVPTVIVEMGFLSNVSDDRLMATEYFRQEAAIGIANGVDAYFEWLETSTVDENATGDQTATESPTETDIS